MADYSGYYQCKECGAAGTFYRPAEHKDICSVPATIAAHTLEQARRKQREEVRKEEIRQTWDSLSDDELVEKLIDFELSIEELRERHAAMDEISKIAQLVLYQRKLRHKYWDAMDVRKHAK
jgi:hypothetical protein